MSAAEDRDRREDTEVREETEAAVEENQVADEEQVADEAPAPEADAASELSEMRDKYLRLQAEWDNYRKRTAAEREQERHRATEKLVSNLLQVVDDLERAIDNAPGGDDDPMIAGVRAVYSKLCDVLSREGLEAVDPQPGDAFDIQVHQAVSTVDDKDQPDESISQVYQKGYTMGGKILRPAMVVVTKGGPVREPEPDSDGDDEETEQE